MHILIIHPGYSMQRHFNYHELIVSLLKEVYSAEADVLSCNKAIKACGFRNSLGSNINSRFIQQGGKLGCWRCQKKHRKRTKGFCEKNMSVKQSLCKDDYVEASRLADQFSGVVNLDCLLDFKLDGVNIGIDIWQSIQRYLFVGAPEKIEIKKDNIAYEFVKSGVLYAIAISRILEQGHYDYILTNERAYLEWGIANRVALKKGVKVIHTGQDYFTGFGYKGLNISLLKSESEISEPFYSPKKYVFDNVVNDKNLLKRYSNEGFVKLRKWMGSDQANNSNNEISRWFTVNRNTVVVFTHLCWDASITFGEMLYHSFEEWLKVTYEIAVSNKDVDWIFRIHPAEAKAELSSELNTLVLLKSLEEQYQPNHIKIMEGDVNIRTIDMVPFIYAGVTALGTVAFELPSYQIPCIVASKKGYAEYDYSISANCKDEYEDMIFNISNITAPSESQINLARAYAGLVLDSQYILPLNNLFNEQDCSDEILDRDNLQRWMNDHYTQKYIRHIFEETIDDFLDYHDECKDA